MILLGRVILGDMAFADHGLAGFEKVLLRDLPRSPAPIGEIADSVPERVRSALIHDGVARGWLRHLHHDQRTPGAEGLARQLRAFQRELRQLRQQSGQDLLSGSLLPYAVHFGLVPVDAAPLARLAYAWVSAFADRPGWRPAAPARSRDDEAISISSDHDLSDAANLAWAAGLI